MNDIDIVIRIPEEVYKGLLEGNEISGGECAWLLSAVKNGTPLSTILHQMLTEGSRIT